MKANQAPLIHPALERHYSVEEICKLWGFSDKTVKKIFADEPGVLRIGRPGSSTRRGYETLRIPESVLLRVHARLRGARRSPNRNEEVMDGDRYKHNSTP